MALPTRPYVMNQNLVYNINTLSWEPMTQPELGDVTIEGPLAVTGPLTNTELRAAPVVITGAVVAL